MNNIYNEYHEAVKGLMIYPNIPTKDNNYFYAILGFIGELGELSDHIDFCEKNYGGENIINDDLTAELGDCFWYVSAVCHEFDFDFVGLMTEMKKNGVKSLNDFHSKILNLVGSISNDTKKIIRDDNYEVSEERRKRIFNSFETTLHYLTSLVKYLDLDIDVILNMNLDKLNDRKKRNKLKGSGDNR